MVQRAYLFATPALAATLLLWLASPVPASCWCLGSWVTPCCPTPEPCLPLGDPCHGYNRTVWQAWPAACAIPQAAGLAPPIAPAVTPVVPSKAPVKSAKPNRVLPNPALSNPPAGESRVDDSAAPELFGSPYHAIRP